MSKLSVAMAAVTIWTSVVVPTSSSARAPADHGQAPVTGRLPAAARALARWLGVGGPFVVGAQPQGLNGPWTIWLQEREVTAKTAAGKRIRFRAPVGQALSVGPAGVGGRFDYYDLAAQPGGGAANPGGPPEDPYRVSGISAGIYKAKAVRIATQWLHHLGISVDRAHVSTDVERPGATDIGTTGLCCFSVLAIVALNRGTMYVVDAGRVVQADVWPIGTPPVRRTCRDHVHYDANQVAVGTRCFDYEQAAAQTLAIDIGRQSPIATNPDAEARIIARTYRMTNSVHAPGLRRIKRTSRIAEYTITYRGTRYTLELIPAFPGLPGSVWPLVRVQSSKFKVQRSTLSAVNAVPRHYPAGGRRGAP